MSSSPRHPSQRALDRTISSGRENSGQSVASVSASPPSKSGPSPCLRERAASSPAAASSTARPSHSGPSPPAPTAVTTNLTPAASRAAT